MKILDDIPFDIESEAVFSRLHLDPNGPYADEVNVLVERARQLARPRALYTVAVVRERQPDAVVIADGSADSAPARFVSRVLRVHLDEVERVFPYVASCGPELDTIPIAPGDVFAQFCRDTIKEMALWAALARLYEHLGDSYGAHAMASLNPGSGDAKVWPIEQQRELFAFLGDVRESIGVVLTESCLMVPNKSVSGILYPSPDGFENCELCRQDRCPNRRAPFNPELWARMFG
jgi:hypothetical protein